MGARLSDRDVARVVKAAGYDPDSYAGHSLRSGFITSAARAGVPEAQIQIQSRHKSLPVPGAISAGVVVCGQCGREGRPVASHLQPESEPKRNNSATACHKCGTHS
jgi:hypothetical protein